MAQIKGLNFISVAGLVLVVGGIIGIALGGYLYLKANAGLESLDAVYAAQNRTLSYDADGNFIDRGSKEGGDHILSLLEDDWKFPLNRSNLDPNDPVVNTPDELMVAFAIINYHTLHSTVDVVLDEDYEYNGTMYPAGTTIPYAVDGKYFSDFSFGDPLQHAARDEAWSPLAWGLTSSLIGGVNSDLTAGMAHFMSWSIFVGLGFMFTVAGVFVTLGGFQLERKFTAEAARVAKEATSGGMVGGTAAPAH
jgi:hypothetical protein